MSGTTFILLFLTLALVSLLIGLWASRRIYNQTDYFLAGRNVGPFALMMTLAATQIGGGLILGTSDEAYRYGIYGMMYAVGIFLGFAFLASGFASKLRGFNISTTAELFETHYHSKTLRKVASILIVLSMCGILVAQVVAAKKFMLGLGINSEGLFIVFWAFVIFYTMVGGLKAVILTDVYQALFILVLFAIIFFITLPSYPLTELTWTPAASVDRLPPSIIAPLLLPLLFCIVEQDLAQRCFSARTKKIANLGAGLAAIAVLLFGFIPTYFGVLAQHLPLTIPDQASALVVLMAEITSPWVLALVAVGLLAAIISTSDSLLCAIASNIAQDFELHHLTGKAAVNFSRLLTFLIGITALVMAYQFDNIIAILVQSYELPVSALFIPILFACLCRKVHQRAAVYAVFTGIMAFILFKFINIGIPREIAQLGAALFAYLLGWWLATSDKTRNPR